MNYAAVASLTLDQFRARVWCGWQMVSGSAIGWGIREHGYTGFVPQQIRPVLDRGWTRLFIARPFGDDAAKTGQPMNEDAWVENTEPMARDFAGAMAGLEGSDPECVVNAYFGSAWDPDYGRQMRTGKWNAWVDRKRRSLGGVLDLPNCDISFDHSATLCAQYEAEQAGGAVPGFPLGSWRPSWAWLELVSQIKQMQGREVWIESVPFREATHQHRLGCVCRTFKHPTVPGATQSEWVRSRPADDVLGGFSDSNGNAPSQVLSGRVLDWNTICSRHPIETYAQAIGDVLARGPQHEWCGALNYLPATAEQVHKAVIVYAGGKSDDDNSPDSPA